ncbi:MAG: ABC transporter permease, partial [Myxococcota bacterium]
MVPLSYIFRSLVQRRQTTIATALGISLVVFVLSSSIMLAEGVNAAMGLSADPEDVIVLRKGSDTELG